MGLEDRARKHIASRDAAAARQDEALAQWQARQRAHVQQILSEFVQLVRRYGVAPVTLFNVVPVVKKPLFAGKMRLDFRFEAVAQVWEIGKREEWSRDGEILTITEDLQVIRAIRIENVLRESVLVLENRCARTFPPHSGLQLRPEEIQPTDLQPSGLDAFTIPPISLAADGAVLVEVQVGIFRDEPPWIERVVERAAVAIIDHDSRR